MEPERRDLDRSTPERTPLSSAERGRVVRAAALRPLNVVVLAIGAGIFATTLAWWMVPLTLVTYALLVFFASRDPLFARRVLYGREDAGLSRPTADQDVSPERRARWLPRGETREKVEAALVVYRKVVDAIEESDEVTRAVLDDAVPKLHAAANQLVDVAQRREKAAEVLSDLDLHTAASSAREDDSRALRERLRAADAEISDTFDKLLALRSRVVRVSIDSGSLEGAAALNASLDELNARLEALGETMTPPEPPSQHR
ncbi:MAG: hypothetical protein ACJ73Z_04570 [Rubrobacteraceae bacterium]